MSGASGGRPVLWLSTNAVQLAGSIGDDGQLMSRAWPVLWLSTNANAAQIFLRLRRALFRSSFAFPRYTLQTFPFLRRSSSSLCSLFRSYVVPLYRSSDFSVRMSFPLIALQTFPFLCRSSLSLFRLFRSYVVPLFRSSDFSGPRSFLFIVLLSARHFLDGGVFRSIGNFSFYYFFCRFETLVSY